MSEPKLSGIAYKTASRAPMTEVLESDISVAEGLKNDYKGVASKKRQITVLSKEDWNTACEELKKDIPWTVRRANLLIEGYNLKNATGKKIQIGHEVILEITGETKPCYRMEEQQKGLMPALLKDWRGGVCCKVIRGGRIRVHDPVKMID